MRKITLLATLLSISVLSHGQRITEGLFGGLGGSGANHLSQTKDKWLKIGELTLNGGYIASNIFIEFFPRSSNHGDSHQKIEVGFRNGATGTGLESSYDLSLVTYSGHEKSVKDVRVIHHSGSGTTNNKVSVWVQMGSSWLYNVPIEVRSSSNATFHTTHQPFYATIPETGTVYEKRIFYEMSGERMRFKGEIECKAVTVQANNWPDYVFEEGYELQTLSDTKAYIKENGHLPNIPSAVEVEEGGADLGEMNRLLMEKVEELTLHLIEQKERIDELERRLGD